MPILDRQFPRPATLDAALRKTTEGLAKELACPARSAPHWSGFEWTIARAVAAMHGVSPLLARTLRWEGPAGWRRFLDEQKSHTAKRHQRIEELLLLIDQRARRAGVGTVALKGVALHALGMYEPGERPMADIDLLVRPAAAQSMAGILESLGYREIQRTWKERVFKRTEIRTSEVLGEHSDSGIPVELHERICEKLPWLMTDISQRVFPVHLHPGLNAYPSKAALMMHLLLHAAGSMAFQSLRMLQLHDVALLCGRMTAADWDDILAPGPHGPRPWWAFPPLALTSRYYPSKVPQRVLPALAGECPYWLERLAKRESMYDVSYSYLWVDAFPGIQWSQTVREMLQYASNRLKPGAELLLQRERLAATQVWASRSQWPRLSQGRRILRWITSRPMRPLTVHAVRAALAQAP